MRETYSPGPWVVDDSHVHAPALVYRDNRWVSDGSDIVFEVDCSCRKGEMLTETDKANLRMGAASPTLYSALSDLVEFMEPRGDYDLTDALLALEMAVGREM